MRATIHNARKGKNGVFSPKHNDRKFNISHTEHINQKKINENRYWNWIGDPQKTFEDAEIEFYEKYIKEHLDAQNARYKAQRHTERIKTIDEYRKSPHTCPEEVIWMIGKTGDTIPADMMTKIIQEQINWEQREFPGIKVLNVALHMDEEGAPHIHERRVWLYTDKQGNNAIGQNKSLEQMGIQLPNPNKPQSRYNNRKQEFSKICRKHFLQVCKKHGLEIEEHPQEKSRSGLTQIEYKTRQITEKKQILIKEKNMLQFQISTLSQKKTCLQEEIADLDKQLREKKVELYRIKEYLHIAEQREIFNKIYLLEHEHSRVR